MVGLVVAHNYSSEIAAAKIRGVTDYLDDNPILDESDLWLVRFTSDYYHHPLGEVVFAALPAHLRSGKALHPTTTRYVVTDQGENCDVDTLARRAPKQGELLQWLLDAGGNGLLPEILVETLPNWQRAMKALLEKSYVVRLEERVTDADFEADPVSESAQGPTLNAEQQLALNTLNAATNFGVHVLDGVTGSGKTEVYLRRIVEVIDGGKQVLVLVPEIGLTPQLISRFEQRLGFRPAILHSGLTDLERLTAWRNARSGLARVVIGTRSAVFVPLAAPGLIIVDEEHDQSFKQQEGLRYSARDLAIARAKQHDVAIVLGSATPSLELLHHASRGIYQHLVLPSRAGGAAPPSLRLIDTIRAPTTDGVSEPLAEAIGRHLNDDGQVLIYLNRRGYAPTLICAACGHLAGCKRCDARMTVHARQRQLRCHHCGSSRPLPDQCEECGEVVRPLGEGTERLEESLRARFPGANIRRIDSDTVQQKGAMDRALQSATDGSSDILVGTQMLSKGHHFPKLTLVGVVNADQGLFGTDFRSSERLAQSIIQVAGRAGREQRAGEVLIQTAFADNIFWQSLLAGGYTAIATAALDERQKVGWPPYSRLALLRAAAHNSEDAAQFLEHAAQLALGLALESLRILGPVDAPMARKAGRFRAQLLLQSTERRSLHHALSVLRPQLESSPEARRVRWSIDVDPIELF